MFPVTFVAEWVLTPGLGLIILSQKGKITRAFSIFFFILAIPFAIGPQYFLLFNETAGTMTEITFKPYPTNIITLFLVMHFALIAVAVEFLFDDMDRNALGQTRKPGPSR